MHSKWWVLILTEFSWKRQIALFLQYICAVYWLSFPEKDKLPYFFSISVLFLSYVSSSVWHTCSTSSKSCCIDACSCCTVECGTCWKSMLRCKPLRTWTGAVMSPGAADAPPSTSSSCFISARCASVCQQCHVLTTVQFHILICNVHNISRF